MCDVVGVEVREFGISEVTPKEVLGGFWIGVCSRRRLPLRDPSVVESVAPLAE